MSQAQRTKSEFLGLYDPYAAVDPDDEAPRPPAGPLLTREALGELARAGAAFAVLLLAIAVMVALIR